MEYEDPESMEPLQNVTTSRHAEPKDEDKLKPARMLSEMIVEERGEEIEFEQPKAITDGGKGSAAPGKVYMYIPVYYSHFVHKDVCLT